MHRLMIGLLLSFVAAAAHSQQQPQVNLEGRLISQNGRTVLRAGGDTYELRFQSSSMMTFARDLLGEDVRVHGTLQLRTENGRQRAVVWPGTIDRLNAPTGPAVEQALNTSVDSYTGSTDDIAPAENVAPPVQSRVYTRFDRRKALVTDTDLEPAPTPFYNRVDRRKEAVRNGGRTHYRGEDYHDVYISPSGGMVIRNR